VRDLVSAEDFDLLLVPWTRRPGEPGLGRSSWAPPNGANGRNGNGASSGGANGNGARSGWLRRLTGRAADGEHDADHGSGQVDAGANAEPVVRGDGSSSSSGSAGPAVADSTAGFADDLETADGFDP